jgi:hypothetical protein
VRGEPIACPLTPGTHPSEWRALSQTIRRDRSVRRESGPICASGVAAATGCRLAAVGLPLEELGDLARVRGLEQRPAQQPVGVWIAARADRGPGAVEVVFRAPVLDTGPEQQPYPPGGPRKAGRPRRR